MRLNAASNRGLRYFSLSCLTGYLSRWMSLVYVQIRPQGELLTATECLFCHANAKASANRVSMHNDNSAQPQSQDARFVRMHLSSPFRSMSFPTTSIVSPTCLNLIIVASAFSGLTTSTIPSPVLNTLENSCECMSASAITVSSLDPITHIG